VKAEKTSPPAASRIYGITAVALYESIVAGAKKNHSLAGQLNGLTMGAHPKTKKYHWPSVANATVARTIRGLYPTLSSASVAKIDELEHRLARGNEGERRDSIAYGRSAAGAILGWAAADGFSTYDNCPYLPAVVAGAWQPTPPAFNPNPLQPCWGQLRPMALKSAAEAPPTGNPAFSTDSTSAFFAAAREVHVTGLNLTAGHKAIADFWADNAGTTGTPPGHWISIVSQIANQDDLSLSRAAEAYARVGIAVHDAFIQCWRNKYIYNLQRPVTFIRNNVDPNWSPYLVTPNFPPIRRATRPNRPRQQLS
jgi:hypothetical protein